MKKSKKPMTVGKLIKNLIKYPMEAEVVCFDYRDYRFHISSLEGCMEMDEDGPVDLVKINFHGEE